MLADPRGVSSSSFPRFIATSIVFSIDFPIDRTVFSPDTSSNMVADKCYSYFVDVLRPMQTQTGQEHDVSRKDPRVLRSSEP